MSWDHKEKNRLGASVADTRQITVGTTLAIEWKEPKGKEKVRHRVRALLTSDYTSAKQRADRDRILGRLFDDGILRVGETGRGPDGNMLCGAVHAEVMDGLMRVRGMARTLHICEGDRS